MVTVILANNLLAMQLPQASIVIRTGRHKIGRVGAERAVPDPALVARQGSLEGERVRVAVVVQLGSLLNVHLPDLGGVVRGAGRELLNVGGEQDTRDVFLMG